jgi:tetratricopeptide (TPR) repeat protein
LFFGLLELGLRVGGYGYPTSFFVPPTDAVSRSDLVSNYDFTRRFFPPALARTPIPLAIRKVKSPGTYRIFVLGESAAQGFPDPASSFSRILEVMLRERYSGKRFEVVNTAVTAINSHVIVPIARECATHEPDLFVAYMGNNEVVGPFGAADVMGRNSLNLSLIRANVAVKGTRTGQLMGALLRRIGPGGEAPQFWGGMEMFVRSQVRATDAALPQSYDHFRRNLDDICGAAAGAGASVILCTVPVNLKDCAPFGSLHAPGCAGDGLKRWERAYTEATKLQSDGKFAAALERFDEAATLDNQFADLEFRLAQCHAAVGNGPEAAARYARARDLDTIRFRADTTVNETIRQVAAVHAPGGTRLVDAERAFAAASPGGAPGEEFFFEHVHLNFHGNYLLARTILDEIDRLLPPSDGKPEVLTESACAERLAYTAWNEYQDVGQVCEMFRHPPFTNQSDRTERDRRWEKRLQELRSQRQPAQLKEAAARCEKAAAASPDDWMILLRCAQVLSELGRLDDAIRQCQAAARRHPYVYSVLNRLGSLQLRAGKADEARQSFRAALRLAPDFSAAHFGLAEVLAAEGHINDAVAAYAEQIERTPDRSEALVQMAGFLSRVGRPADARQKLKEAITLHPDDPLLHVHLGNALSAEGALTEAIEEFETALRLRPDWPEMADHLTRLNKLRDERR